MVHFSFNKKAVCAIDLERGEIADVLYDGSRINAGRVPMFSVKLRNRTGKSRVVRSTECAFVGFDGSVASYACADVDVQVLLRQTEQGLIWRINVQNKTQELVEWVELMSFSVPQKLQDEQGGVGSIVYPYNEGCLVTNMAYRESMPFRYSEPEYPSKNSYSIFPNMVFAQFIAYVGNRAGIYLGMHDEERTTKHIDFCYTQDGIKIFMRTFCDVSYGQDYSMPFDGVFTLFEGGWHKAADIYYAWFCTHLPEGLQKISENMQLPKWYHEAPLIVAYPLRGKKDTDMSDNGLYPYRNALPYLDEIARETDGKLMALLMHWEGSAPWAPPYSWPPYGGEEALYAFADELHSRDMCIGLYCSGLGWTQQSRIDASYDMHEAFENLRIAEQVCANSDGAIGSHTCLSQRSGYDFCPACDSVKKLFKEEFEKLCGGKIDYVQALDQNHGGGPCFCYSEGHEHVPAPGKWQQIETNKLLSSIDRNGVLFGCESAAAEPFLAQLQFSDNRYQLNYYVGTPIPVYAYLYHEYVNNFMGNQICAMLEKRENSFTYRLAYSFAAGDMLTVVMNGNGELQHAWCDYVEPKNKHVDKTSALRFIATLNEWRRQGGGEFLHCGKMIQPLAIKCAEERFLLEDGKTYFKTPAVVTAAYEYAGKRVQFVVNYNFRPVEITLDGQFDVYTCADLTACERAVDGITIAPLSVIMIDMENE